ncbi:hypothetical protein [Rhizobium sp. L43]|uniref:hypothetical protein n=1 Tax=Rhizobium sp. L43 TaxID=2035452 RepID=UPI000BEAD452|nr:hypothetical protein [Rhizobium sp. L43]PDS79648.1 hypothetical protein CO667_08740 [Rhizobium sp. L43]
MFRSLSVVTLLALSTLVALPAAAGDRRHDRFPGHRHAFHNGLRLGERISWRDRGIRIDRAFGRRSGRGMPMLKRFSSPATHRLTRGNLIIVTGAAPADDNIYAGSSYAYQVDGGTYVGGYGYYAAAQPEPRPPKAKVIDVAIQDDPCTYEANVCVIRP